MKRHPLALTFGALAGAVALSGCATFSDSDVAARVGDEQMTHDELASIVRGELGDDAVRAPTDAVKSVVETFVIDRAVRADLARLGTTPPDEPAGDLSYATLQESANSSLSVWQATPPGAFDEDLWRATYELGPLGSGQVCSQHILVDDEAAAAGLVRQLDAGADFAELAAEHSTDTGSAGSGGVLSCMPISQFASSFVAEFVDAAVNADVGEVVGPVQSEFGYHVIRLRPFDEVSLDELTPLLGDLGVRFQLVSADLDVFVDPRFGSFQGANGVVPLG